jgi:hypothetical protein
MKMIIIAAIAASMLSAQSTQKEEPKPKEVATKEAPKEAPKQPEGRDLTKAEAADLQITILKLHILNDRYKLDEYQKEAGPISQKQQSLRDSLCKSIGVPADKVNTECGIQGFDSNGDQINGADGKPVPQKVFRVPQQPVATK